MHRILKSAIAVALVALAVAAVSALGTSSSYGSGTPEARAAASADEVRARLDPSSDKLAQCLPDARVKIAVDLTTDQLGFDIFNVSARHLAPNRDYTVFLLEQAASPFGAGMRATMVSRISSMPMPSFALAKMADSAGIARISSSWILTKSRKHNVY